nr:MAG TPA: hypothetical protein [Caudoviricetes sp.]
MKWYQGLFFLGVKVADESIKIDIDVNAAGAAGIIEVVSGTFLFRS